MRVRKRVRAGKEEREWESKGKKKREPESRRREDKRNCPRLSVCTLAGVHPRSQVSVYAYQRLGRPETII